MGGIYKIYPCALGRGRWQCCCWWRRRRIRVWRRPQRRSRARSSSQVNIIRILFIYRMYDNVYIVTEQCNAWFVQGGIPNNNISTQGVHGGTASETAGWGGNPREQTSGIEKGWVYLHRFLYYYSFSPRTYFYLFVYLSYLVSINI